MPRWMEWLVAFAGSILLLPLFGIIALAVRLEDAGPVWHRPLRTGEGGRRFRMLKFRTMVRNAASLGPPITTRNDGRITAVGAFLRRHKLDELPQLFNVLSGDMGFVGPRPEDPAIADRYPERLRGIFRYRPGITSPASIAFRSEESLIPPDRWESVYLTELLPKKTAMDAGYMQTRTLVSDIVVILKTLFHG
jgi:lipopolysaccharide/colanic/teichoic acid biosynthesis glycosyltransferase